MCNRQKPISREEIELVKIALKNHGDQLIRLMNQVARTGKPWTKSEEAEAKQHRRFIKDNQKLIKEYYKPAIVIE